MTQAGPKHTLCKKSPFQDFPGGPVVKIPTFNAGDPCSIPGWRCSAYHAVWLKKKKVPSSGEELMMKEVLSSTSLW